MQVLFRKGKAWYTETDNSEFVEGSPMKERTSQTRCGTIHYWASVSNPDAITLVFLPGLTADHRLFDKQIQYFENRYNVIVWDAPAHILFCLEAWYTLHIDAPEGRMEMETEKVYAMPFAKIYPMLVAKAVRKGRTQAEVDEMIGWLTGYSAPQIEAAVQNGTLYGDFFRDAPQLNPDRVLIKGSVCGVKLESIEEPLMKEIRYLDKLVDELAKGKAMEKIKRTNK